MKREYIIYTPGYSRRNGVRVLLLLAKHLQQRGHVVSIAVPRPDEFPKDYPIPLMTRPTERQKAEAIVVYPEVVAGNPLRVKNVVRYVLYYPGKNGGAYSYHASERLFAFRPEFFPGIPVLTIPWIDATMFYDDGKSRELDCCLVHKGGKWRDAPETRGLRTITMTDPPTREGLAELLRKTRVLYSYDDCTAVMDEALLCGAEVKVITKDGVLPYVSPYPEIVADFPKQFDAFIAQTEGMDYRGRIESRFVWKCWLNSLYLFVLRPWLHKIMRTTGRN